MNTLPPTRHSPGRPLLAMGGIRKSFEGNEVLKGVDLEGEIYVHGRRVLIRSPGEAIAAVILGGASLSGGRGTIWGAMIGVFLMGLMKNVLIIARFSSEWQGIVLGAVLVAAVALDSLMNRKRIG